MPKLWLPSVVADFCALSCEEPLHRSVEPNTQGTGLRRLYATDQPPRAEMGTVGRHNTVFATFTMVIQSELTSRLNAAVRVLNGLKLNYDTLSLDLEGLLC